MSSYKTSSWQYIMAKRISVMEPSDNFCDFWRQVFLGILVTLFIGFLTLCVLLLVYLGLILPYVVYFTEGILWIDLLDSPTEQVRSYLNVIIIMHFFSAAGMLVMGVYQLKELYSKIKYNRWKRDAQYFDDYVKEYGMPPPVKQDPFIVAVYKSLKEKTCHKITFED